MSLINPDFPVRNIRGMANSCPRDLFLMQNNTSDRECRKPNLVHPSIDNKVRYIDGWLEYKINKIMVGSREETIKGLS